jgi:membrane associated rhomboid family serine protease
MLWAGDRPNPLLNLLAKMSGASPGEFHWYQLVTNVFLHGGIIHLAGNLVFMLVFGNRVNALVGQWKAAALYLLLGVLASASVMVSSVGKPLTPNLGASGAIMGMAGMYIVLMPVSRVYMVFWIRLGMLTGFRRLTKIFSLRGFWVLLFFIAFDVWATLRGSHDHVGHWAHLGGFICGMALAGLLLVTRQINAHGCDAISLALGPRAWKLLGTPAERAGQC